MNIVSFGGGTNSAALLIGLYKHKIPIDLITLPIRARNTRIPINYRDNQSMACGTRYAADYRCAVC